MRRLNTDFRRGFNVILVALSLMSGGQIRRQALFSPFFKPAESPSSDMMVVRGQGGEAEHIETDRDSFTPATTTVAQSRWIVESAWSFVDNRDVPETHSFPELITRYGATDWLELRLGWNYEVGGESAAVSTGGGWFTGREEPEIETAAWISYGAKAYLTEQDDWLPESAFIVQAATPTSGVETATRLICTYVTGWTLANDWVWDSALRYANTSAEGDRFNQWAPSTVLKVPVAERWNAHIEYFGILSDGSEFERSVHYASPGLHYLVTPDLEVGARVGWGLNGQSERFFSNVGFGWQF